MLVVFRLTLLTMSIVLTTSTSHFITNLKMLMLVSIQLRSRILLDKELTLRSAERKNVVTSIIVTDPGKGYKNKKRLILRKLVS